MCTTTSQYRNKSIFDHVTRHEELYGLKSSWHYFESGHGKGACDGIGGVAKRMADNAVKTGRATIQSADDYFQWASQTQGQIQYQFITEEEYVSAFSEVQKRQLILKSIKGTMKFHAVAALDNGNLMARETTCTCKNCFNMEQGFVWTVENNCCWTQDSVNQPSIDYNKFVETLTAEKFQVPDVKMSVESEDNKCRGSTISSLMKSIECKLGDYVSALYDRKWYVGKVVSIDESGGPEYLVSFMEQAGKLDCVFKWPKTEDELWISKKQLICKVSEPSPTGKSKRTFRLTEEDLQLIQDLHKELLN